MNNFTHKPQAKNTTNINKQENYFFSQPHQPFFLAGVVWAIIVMLIFMMSYKMMLKGDINTVISPTMFHAYSLTFIVFTQFFIGFLYTTFSRFCQSEPVKKPYYVRTFFLFQVGSLLMVLGFFLSKTLMLAGMGILLLGQLVFLYMLQSIFSSAQAKIKDDPFWILTSIYLGTAAHAVWIIEVILDLSIFALPFAFNLYLIFMTFSIAQRMVPFFSHSLEPKRAGFVVTVFIALILKSFADIFNKEIFEAMISLLLGLYIFFEVIRWKLSFFQAPNILKILHVALFWMPASLILGSFFQLGEIILQTGFAFADVHMLALGFLTTIIIGFGTRVTLGHSGQPPHADSNTLKLFYLTQVLVVFRLLYSLVFGFDLPLFWLFSEELSTQQTASAIFDISLGLWLVLFIFWGLKFGPVLVLRKK
ncbi:NnrS family protein [Sulfurimonas sp. MAG313]|nr:NnrS family protein [Sulfurimonas sp. MAG313]MDF1881791.1 NnrS family protein [Sulfurimonas sp. MAG313]